MKVILNFGMKANENLIIENHGEDLGQETLAEIATLCYVS